MSNLQVFNFDHLQVRTVVDEIGEPWFCANDVCAALEYSNPHKSIQDHVDPDDITQREAADALGRVRQTNFINESGLYALIFGCQLPTAKRFKRWVTHDVLPTIRKTGSYDAKPVSAARQALMMAQAMVDLEEKMMAQVGAVSESVRRLEAKVDTADGHTGYFTIAAWGNLSGIHIDSRTAASLGRIAVRRSRDEGVMVGSTAHPVHGTVNTYHETILEPVFDSFFASDQSFH